MSGVFLGPNGCTTRPTRLLSSLSGFRKCGFHKDELAAYTARWLELADAALSATEKAAKTLELACEEQHRKRNVIEWTQS